MASVVSDSNGTRRIQWKAADGKRNQIRLGRIDKRNAERVCLKIETLVSAVATGTDPDDETKKWVESLSDQLHERLARLRLVRPRQQSSLKLLFDNFEAGKAGCSSNTRRNISQARTWFFKHFNESQPLRTVTKSDADAFRTFLAKSLKSSNTVNTHIKKVKQAFAHAVEAGMISANPFQHLKSPIRSNPARMEFVKPEWTEPILKACPDIEWKIIFAMARYAGVRVPSELRDFTWGDINWEQNRIRIHDEKRSRPGSPVIRIIPLFPELEPILAEALDQVPPGSLYVCPRARDGAKNLRTQMHRIIKKAKLTPWQRTFQNMRSTRETELAEYFPMHVVNKWIGNTESVAVQHYLQVTNDHFERAVAQFNGDGDDFEIDIDAFFKEAAEAAQNPAQPVQDSQELETTDDDNEKPQVPDASGTCGHSRRKSLSGKDLRIPPRGVEPLSSG
jgi:integrase